jgi:hypothetical protein
MCFLFLEATLTDGPGLAPKRDVSMPPLAMPESSDQRDRAGEALKPN